MRNNPQKNKEIFIMKLATQNSSSTLAKSVACDRLLTREQVAQYLSIGKTLVEKLRRQGRLPSIRISGKCIRYRQSDCDKLLENSTVYRHVGKESA